MEETADMKAKRAKDDKEDDEDEDERILKKPLKKTITE